ncbi:ATP-dependent sacrificial sulfur transferase LarE [Lachnospiraceae bacterium 62-26]
MNNYEIKKEALIQQMKSYASEDLIVAFSGGVDSSLLLKLACEAVKETGKKIYGIFLQTMHHPVREAEEARRVAGEMGAVFCVLKIDELEGAGIADNPLDRCYRCKRHLFREIQKEAEKLGVLRILEGTNEDDLHVYRPGIRAVRELGIISPLADVKVTKEEVRLMADEYGISVSQKPSTPCLATRFPYGTHISYEEMRKVEEGEAYLRNLGLYNVRLRVHGSIARIETDLKDLRMVMERRDMLVEYLKKLGYTYVTLDLEGFRSGSMDVERVVTD